MSDHRLFRARSKLVPEWYVKERFGHFGAIGTLAEAIIQTQVWWETHLNDGWEDFFDLEEAEQGAQPTVIPTEEDEDSP